MKIDITPDLSIDDAEVTFEFMRAPGPGGQKVNKASSAVQLRFDIKNSPSLPEDIRERLLQLGGKRVTDRGVLIITARRYRSQHRNREDGLQRLINLIRRAAREPRKRLKTRPTQESRRRRLAAKRKTSEKKRLRRPVQPDD